MPSSERRYAWRPERKSLPRSLVTSDQPQRALVHALRRERDDPVGDGELGRRARLVLAVFADPEGGRGEGREQRGQLVQEAAEVPRVVGERGQRLEAVDRDDPRPPLLDQRGDALGHGGEPALAGHRRGRGPRRRPTGRSPRDRRSSASGRSGGSSRTAPRPSRGRSRGAPAVAPAKMNCWQRIVLPEPGSPMIRLMPFSGRPPPRIRSSPSSPLVRRSSTSVPARGRATSALAPSRSLTVETSSSGSSGFCRKASAPAASASSRASRAEIGEHGAGLVLLQAPAQLRAPASRDHQLHDRELGPALEPLLLGFAGRERHVAPHSPRCAGRTARAPPPRDRVRRAARAGRVRSPGPSVAGRATLRRVRRAGGGRRPPRARARPRDATKRSCSTWSREYSRCPPGLRSGTIARSAPPSCGSSRPGCSSIRATAPML